MHTKCVFAVEQRFDRFLLSIFKFAHVVVFLKMSESTILKLFQKLIKAYTKIHKEKSGKDVQLEVSGEW